MVVVVVVVLVEFGPAVAPVAGRPAPAPEVVVVVDGTVVLVVVEVPLVSGVWAAGEVVVVVADGDVVVVVELGVVLFRSTPPKNVCPEPDCPRITAESGFCATNSMMLKVAMAITSAAMTAASTGTRMSRQLRFRGRRRTDPDTRSGGPRLASPSSALESARFPGAGGYLRSRSLRRRGRWMAAWRMRAWARRIDEL